jgi:type VI secretion system secreted protein Hcp
MTKSIVCDNGAGRLCVADRAEKERLMRISKPAALLVVAVVATAVVAVGMTTVFTAGASTGPTTYYGCLRSGKLIDVGVTAPTCPGSASQISWNSQGSVGPAGTQGPVGQASVVDVPAASLFANPCPQPPPPPPTSSSSGVQMWLNIPGVPGESTDANHMNQIDVSSFSLGVGGSGGGASCAGNHSSTGQGASGLQFSIVKKVDKSSPTLTLGSATGVHYPTVTLTMRKGGASQDFLTYTFSTVFVTEVQWGGSNGSDELQEGVTFQYSQVSVSYSQQNSDGSFASPIQTCFNFESQQSC